MLIFVFCIFYGQVWRQLMEQVVQEHSQVATDSRSESDDTNVPGLVKSPPHERQRDASFAVDIATRNKLQQLHPTQSDADMFLTLKARLEVCTSR